MRINRSRWAMVAGVLASFSCARRNDESGAGARVPRGIAPERAADMIHAVLAADREAYTVEIVQRLTVQQKVQVAMPGGGPPVPLEAREDWRGEHAKLPLPAQMFRLGAEAVLAANTGFSYLLLSSWPVNRQNRPRTEVEQAGLDRIAQKPDPYYADEILEGKRYFVAIYPDVAIAEACVKCHNAHPDSPRRDFKVGDVMGGVVIRLPME